MVAAEANGQPAAMAWLRGAPFGMAVLTVAEEGDPELAEGVDGRGRRGAGGPAGAS